MISFDTIAFIVLVVVLIAVVFVNRKKLEFSRFGIFYVAMYRGQTGIKTMDYLAKKYGKFFRFTATITIAIGFIGMGVVVFDLARSLIMVLGGLSAPSVGIVAPFKAKGVFYVPFFYWIISIFGILVLHEGMHGVMARVYNLPVKNSGLLVLGAIVPLIPGAFVEPDEEKLMKAPKKQQLAVYAAGPVINIVSGFALMALFMLILTPFTSTFYSTDGVVITELMDGNPPAMQAGLAIGEKITQINGAAIGETQDFTNAFEGTKPGDVLNLVTTKAVYDVTLGENPATNRAWLGVFVENPLASPTWMTYIILWLKELVYWFALLSIGVGLFNLVPLGPIDGGRMFLTALEYFHPSQTKATTIWKSVSFVLLGILLTNVVLAFV